MSGFIGAPQPSRRCALSVDGHVFDRWSSVSITRDLRNIAGEFSVTYFDSARLAAAVRPDLDPRPHFEVVKAGMKCSLALDGETVLAGYIDGVSISWNSGAFTARITGRDATGDLVDCAAAPVGPLEWRGLTVLQIAAAIAKPFGVAVRADVDLGAAFPVFGVNIEETALIAIERAARQRALLVVSDGVGGLLLTKGGSTRAPSPLSLPGNIQDAQYSASWRGRFSDYYVKGQTNPRLAREGRRAGLSSASNPTSAPGVPPDVSRTVAEAASVKMTGHAIDPEITRYRPNVRGVRTQSGSASVQAQAEWALRVARGMGETLTYTVLDWRAGEGGALWLPNALTRVSDPYAGINRDMLISGLTYQMDAGGIKTMLTLSGRTAFDRIDEPSQSERYIFKKAPKSFGPTRNG